MIPLLLMIALLTAYHPKGRGIKIREDNFSDSEIGAMSSSECWQEIS